MLKKKLKKEFLPLSKSGNNYYLCRMNYSNVHPRPETMHNLLCAVCRESILADSEQSARSVQMSQISGACGVDIQNRKNRSV